MKKLLVLIMILAVVPVIAFGETDPIVGAWYFFVDTTAYPEYKPEITSDDYAIGIYIFKEDGTVASIETYILGDDFVDNTTVNGGVWSVSDGTYSYRILSFGAGNAYLKGDELHVRNGEESEGYYAIFRRLVPYNFYKDVVVY